MIKIIVDCYGGDKSPQANIDGALQALKDERMKDLFLVLSGNEKEISNYLALKRTSKLNNEIIDRKISILNAEQVITPDEKPIDVIRFKKNSSLIEAVNLLKKEDDICGMVSTGSTGALVAASVLLIGRLKNVLRPAFCPILPTMNGSIVGVCDSGANVDINPEYIQQYAIMGSLFMKSVYNISSPRIALLNVGTEKGKGDKLHKDAYDLLESTPNINFLGNMESRDLLSGKYDLIVCDGFSGNVLIKTTEGTAIELLKKLKEGIYSKFLYKFGGFLIKGLFRDFKELMNYQNYGGSVLLGISKIVVKGHGSSNSKSVHECIYQAYSMERNSFSINLENELSQILKTNESNIEAIK